jgi:hypothetical protein
LQSGLALSLTPSTATFKLGDHSASRHAIYRKLNHVNIKRKPGSLRQDESKSSNALCSVDEMKAQKLLAG